MYKYWFDSYNNIITGYFSKIVKLPAVPEFIIIIENRDEEYVFYKVPNSNNMNNTNGWYMSCEYQNKTLYFSSHASGANEFRIITDIHMWYK